MDSLILYLGDIPVGELCRDELGVSFCYLAGYAGPPAFLNWSVQHGDQKWQGLPAELACLLPEGVQLKQWRLRAGATESSAWELLAATGADLPGAVSVLPSDSKLSPLGRIATEPRKLNRSKILPNAESLPYAAETIATANSRAGFTHSLASTRVSASAIYSRKDSQFRLVETNGSYRVTLESTDEPEWVANQVLTARLAHDAGLSVATVGSIQTADRRPALWSERFDRTGASNCQRSRLESACQLLEKTPKDKYEGSIENVAGLIQQHCTNPKIQLMRFFHRVVFGWLTGNGSLHLKKWSLLQNGPIVELSPAYSLMNDALDGRNAAESALTIGGTRQDLDHSHLINHLGRDICGLDDRMINRVLKQLAAVKWEERILDSDLSKPKQRAYFELLGTRWRRLQED
ncbi:MAG: type II toxin-antitoxin system HipA family toxin [Opitutaceae bacterium]